MLIKHIKHKWVWLFIAGIFFISVVFPPILVKANLKSTYTEGEVFILHWNNCLSKWSKIPQIGKCPTDTKKALREPLRASQGHINWYCDSKIIQYIKTKDWDSKIAYKIMIAESGCKVNAINKNKNNTIDKGLFQINSIHKEKDLYNWKHNIDVAYKIYKNAKKIHNGDGWKAWSAYNNGSYKKISLKYYYDTK